MTADDDRPGFSLKRWSQRKLDAARSAPPSGPAPTADPPAATSASADPDASPLASAPVSAPAGNEAAGTPPAPLPPIESLGVESDFTPFLRAKVDEAVKRQALKKLFQDPRFNVVDGLDVYLDDYSLPDPISPEEVRALHHVRSFFAPPKTRINAQGCVEDVPADEAAATAGPPGADALPEPEPAAPPTFGAVPAGGEPVDRAAANDAIAATAAATDASGTDADRAAAAADADAEADAAADAARGRNDSSPP
jgi:hypothetical protein